MIKTRISYNPGTDRETRKLAKRLAGIAKQAALVAKGQVVTLGCGEISIRAEHR